MTRSIKRGGKIWIRVFPDKPITKKPAETRMGKGKGAPEGWVAVIRPGRIIYEMEGVSPILANEALRLAAARPTGTRVVLVGSLEHVEGVDGGGLLRSAQDLLALWSVMYALRSAH